MDRTTGNWYLSTNGFFTLPDGRVVNDLVISPKSPLYRSLYVNMEGLTWTDGLFDRVRSRLWQSGDVAASAAPVGDFVVADNRALASGNAL